MRLPELIKDSKDIKVCSTKKTYSDLDIKGITFDSKTVKDRFLFVAISGSKDNGHNYISEAISKGAKAIFVEKPRLKKVLPGIQDNLKKGLALLQTNNSRVALAELANSFYNYPSDRLKITGVTGTNGKTTITYLVENILKFAFGSAGVLGTINYRSDSINIPAANTTPDPLKLNACLAQMRKDAVSHVVMEVSSHSLEQNRISGIRFDNAIFTNLTQDHLDYHRTIEKYFAAKSKLFINLDKFATAIINVDDKFGLRLLKKTKANILTYAIRRRADIKAEKIHCNKNGLFFDASTPLGKVKIKSRLIGEHNVYNILAATALGVSYGVDLEAIKEAIYRVNLIPGRLEEVSENLPFKVFVDYAHTEDALKNVLTALRKLFDKRIIVVFGCGGNRDKKKRPLMGKIAEKLADWVILTSDNPRFEDAGDIVFDILSGMQKSNHEIELDRFNAIERAISLARPEDVVLIAGKGHENYQVFKNTIAPFDDRQVAAKIIESSRILNME